MGAFFAGLKSVVNLLKRSRNWHQKNVAHDVPFA